MANDIGHIIEEIKQAEGNGTEPAAFRELERLMYERTGDKVSAQHIINVSRGLAQLREREARKLARAFPKFAERIFRAVGMDDGPLPAPAPPLPERLAEVSRRVGRSEAELTQLFEDWLLRAGFGDNAPHPRRAVTA